MKIYQVIEYGGQYEDAYEDVRGTFLKEENAKAYLEYSKRVTEMMKESIDTQLKRCSECHDKFKNAICESDFINLQESIESDCPHFPNLQFIDEYVECEHYDETCSLYHSDDLNCRFTLREFYVMDALIKNLRKL